MVIVVRVSMRVLGARMKAGFIHKRLRLYAEGTSGARWCPDVRSVV